MVTLIILISWLKMVRLVKWTVLNLSHTGLEMGWWSGHYGKICTPQQVGQWLLAVARWNLCQRVLEPHTCLWLLWLIVWIVSQQKSFQCCNCLKFIKVWWVVFANKLLFHANYRQPLQSSSVQSNHREVFTQAVYYQQTPGTTHQSVRKNILFFTEQPNLG